MRNINVSTRFVGLNKTDVRNYIDNLTKEQENDLARLTDEIKRLQREKDKVDIEIDDAKREEVRYEDETAPDDDNKKIVNDAYKRLDKTVALINMIADEETDRLAQSAKKNLDEYDKIIEELQEDIDDKKKKIESLLSDVLGLLKSNIDEVTSEKNEKPQKEERRSYYDEFTKNQESLFESEEFEAELESIKSEKITADGTSLNGIPKLLMFQRKYGVKSDDGATRFEEKGNPFLDDDFENASKDESADLSFIENEAFDDVHEEYEREEETPMPVEAAKGDQEINKMRNALIIGKVAGEDILDGENNVIVPKGKVLTKEDITLAESQGKLPELIINMWLPK